MRIFFQKIFDSYVTGTQPVYTDTGVSQLLASTDRLDGGIQVFGVTGTSPTLTIAIENSFDGTRWQDQYPVASGGPDLNQFPLVAGDNPPITFTNGLAAPILLDRQRLRITLGGTSPAAVIRIWLGGRSPQF